MTRFRMFRCRRCGSLQERYRNASTCQKTYQGRACRGELELVEGAAGFGEFEYGGGI
jgi:hypothetical protein